jgi:hypothetical protein
MLSQLTLLTNHITEMHRKHQKHPPTDEPFSKGETRLGSCVLCTLGYDE